MVARSHSSAQNDTGTGGGGGSDAEGGNGGAVTGGADSGGTSSGGSTSGGAGSGGTSSAGAGGITEGGSGGDAGQGGAGGGGVVLPVRDYVLYSTNSSTSGWFFAGAQVIVLNSNTGEEEFTGTIANPITAQPEVLFGGLAALPDGTLRAAWIWSGQGKIVKLDADLNVLDVVDVTSAPNGVDYAVLADGSRALLGNYMEGGLATLTPLADDDTIDLNAPVTTISASLGYPAAYFAPPGSGRLLWACSIFASCIVSVSVLTADAQLTAQTHSFLNTSDTDPSNTFIASDYHVSADGTVRIAWTAYSTVDPTLGVSRICTYATEAGTYKPMPTIEGWGPDTCWKLNVPDARGIRYASFRR